MKMFDKRETAAIIAGLRTLQYGLGQDIMWHRGLVDILTDDGTLEPPTADEIDELCERINLCTVDS